MGEAASHSMSRHIAALFAFAGQCGHQLPNKQGRDATHAFRVLRLHDPVQVSGLPCIENRWSACDGLELIQHHFIRNALPRPPSCQVSRRGVQRRTRHSQRRRGYGFALGVLLGQYGDHCVRIFRCLACLRAFAVACPLRLRRGCPHTCFLSRFMPGHAATCSRPVPTRTL